jgi:hypothetical protein
MLRLSGQRKIIQTFTRVLERLVCFGKFQVFAYCIAAVAAQELADALSEAISAAKCLSFVCSVDLGEGGEGVRGEKLRSWRRKWGQMRQVEEMSGRWRK